MNGFDEHAFDIDADPVDDVIAPQLQDADDDDDAALNSKEIIEDFKHPSRNIFLSNIINTK